MGATMRKHVKILGWLQIGLGLVDLAMGLAGFGVFSGMGVLSGDLATFGVFSLMGGFVSTIMLIMALPNLLVGLGLLLNWGGWVIVLAVILGVFNLAKFPWGTAIAVYTFWITYRLAEAAEATG